MTSHNELPGKQQKHILKIALFLASPFIGLYYAVLLPGKLLQLAMAERQAAKQTPERVQ
jgi:hypothetical protein